MAFYFHISDYCVLGGSLVSLSLFERKGDSHLKHNSLTFTIPCLTPPPHTRPWPLCGLLPPHKFLYFDPPLPCHPLSYWLMLLRAVPFLIPSSFYSHLPAYEDGTECSETSAYKLQTPGNYPKESIQHTEHGESLKSRIHVTCFKFYVMMV